ncbi:MAG: leucine-rich repeat domain-containing protein [Clostridia bacterium]|nr:leucine-rich repeat domain-containing protein [Clostridia bacterium]
MKSNLKKFLVLVPVAVGALACFAACGEHKHTYSENWSHNAQYHWHGATCEHTEEQADKTEHKYTLNVSKSTVTCTEDGVAVYDCECGYSYMQNESAGHLIEFVGGKAATCTEDGATPREVCLRCDYVKESEVIPATGHKYSTAWVWDDDEHWHPATCGHDLKKDVAEHVYNAEDMCSCGRSRLEADPENFTYSKRGSSYTVTGIAATAENVTNLRIPYTYNGLPVTGIENFAFENNKAITRVNIPAGVTVIGREAFSGCTNLATVKVGSGLVEIGHAAFSGCAITEITIPASVTTINTSAFENCANLETVEMLPANLNLLGEQVFSGCSSLVSIRIPTLLENIVTYTDNSGTHHVNINYKVGKNLFLNCTSLQTVTFGGGITAIETNAFANCTSLTSITLPGALTFVGNSAFKNSGLTSITLPDTVTYVGTGAFKDCSALTSAVIGSGVTYTMGEWFSGCGALQSLTIPFVGSRMDTPIAVSTHFGYIFGTTAPKTADADKYEAVTVTENEKSHTYYIPKSLTSVTVLGGQYDEWRKNPSGGDDIKTVKDYVLPANAFSGCTMITEVTLAEGVGEESDAFAGWYEEGKTTVIHLGSGS